MLHGREEAERAAEAARAAFEDGAISADLPTVAIASAELSAGLGLLNALVTAGLCPSTSDARRQIKGGAVRLNDAAVSDERLSIGVDAITPEGVIKLSLGKKKHVLLKPAD